MYANAAFGSLNNEDDGSADHGDGKYTTISEEHSELQYESPPDAFGTSYLDVPGIGTTTSLPKKDDDRHQYGFGNDGYLDLQPPGENESSTDDLATYCDIDTANIGANENGYYDISGVPMEGYSEPLNANNVNLYDTPANTDITTPQGGGDANNESGYGLLNLQRKEPQPIQADSSSSYDSLQPVRGRQKTLRRNESLDGFNHRPSDLATHQATVSSQDHYSTADEPHQPRVVYTSEEPRVCSTSEPRTVVYNPTVGSGRPLYSVANESSADDGDVQYSIPLKPNNQYSNPLKPNDQYSNPLKPNDRDNCDNVYAGARSNVYADFSGPSPGWLTDFSRTEAAAVVRSIGVFGAFLVRRSQNSPSGYAMCVMTEEGILNFSIVPAQGQQSTQLKLANSVLCFDTITALVDHYLTTEDDGLPKLRIL